MAFPLHPTPYTLLVVSLYRVDKVIGDAASTRYGDTTHSMPMPRLKPHAEGHQNLERWLLTYADMITLLTAFFLMLYSMSVVSKGKFTALATSVRSGFNGIAVGGPSLLTGGGAHTSQPGILPDGTHQQYEQAMRN